MYQLDKGIFLEDKNVLLEWGHSVDKLATVHQAHIIKKPDRIIFDWGKHVILDGLKLDLTNTFLGLSALNAFKKFYSISSWAVGDAQAKNYFDIISQHLIKKIGEPTEKKPQTDIIGEEFWVWRTQDVNIILNLFEQHAFKTCLTIEAKNR